MKLESEILNVFLRFVSSIAQLVFLWKFEMDKSARNPEISLKFNKFGLSSNFQGRSGPIKDVMLEIKKITLFKQT